ncbi:MAG: hypothetical protein ACLGHN_02445 [Bacteriovoracia bacterium]
MKILVPLILFSFVSLVHARDCEVYGISDSPQNLHCSFDKLDIVLSCDNQHGTYYLNSSPVKVAYHLEVEHGPVPLVFKTDDLELVVTMRRRGAVAELETEGRIHNGSCQTR